MSCNATVFAGTIHYNIHVCVRTDQWIRGSEVQIAGAPGLQYLLHMQMAIACSLVYISCSFISDHFSLLYINWMLSYSVLCYLITLRFNGASGASLGVWMLAGYNVMQHEGIFRIVWTIHYNVDLAHYNVVQYDVICRVMWTIHYNKDNGVIVIGCYNVVPVGPLA
jgi:hypothetical protein